MFFYVTYFTFLRFIFMKLNYTIPTKKKDITLSTYLDIQALIKEEVSDDLIVSKLIGIEHHYLKYFPKTEYDNIKLTVLNTLKEVTELVKRFDIDGVEYGFIPNLENITVGEFADLETLFSDPVGNAYQLMNVMYRPIIDRNKDTYLIEPYNSANDLEVFKNIPCTVYDNAVGFFLTLKQQLQDATLRYTEVEQAQKKERTLRKSGVGIKLSIQ